jgi:NAD-dependent deacetylase
MNPRDLAQAAKLLATANPVACLTGAGVSAESGIPTFRDAQTGLWARFSPEELASPAGFRNNPSAVWRWYMSRLKAVEDALPNPGHRALADLEQRTSDMTLITQNVDDLHERAGSRRVIHLHGSITRFRCSQCRVPYPLQPGDRERDNPPECPFCSGLIRPDVVWFGEMLPGSALETAFRAAETCDVMLVVGTSGIVYPAAHLPAIAQQSGAKVIDVNPQPGPISQLADVFLQGPSGQVLPQLLQALADET